MYVKRRINNYFRNLIFSHNFMFWPLFSDLPASKLSRLPAFLPQTTTKKHNKYQLVELVIYLLMDVLSRHFVERKSLVMKNVL
jgi:hypothetical protein